MDQMSSSFHRLCRQQSYLKGAVEIKVRLYNKIRYGQIEDFNDAIHYLSYEAKRTSEAKDRVEERIVDFKQNNPNRDTTWTRGHRRVTKIYLGKSVKAQKIIDEIQDGSYSSIEDLCEQTRISRNHTFNKIAKNQKKIDNIIEVA